MNSIYFQKICMNMFTLQKLNKGDKITKEDDGAVSIFIIKDGEFEITTRKSNIELCNVVKDFGGNTNKYYKEIDLYRGIYFFIKNYSNIKNY